MPGATEKTKATTKVFGVVRGKAHWHWQSECFQKHQELGKMIRHSTDWSMLISFNKHMLIFRVFLSYIICPCSSNSSGPRGWRESRAVYAWFGFSLLSLAWNQFSCQAWAVPCLNTFIERSMKSTSGLESWTTNIPKYNQIEFPLWNGWPWGQYEMRFSVHTGVAGQSKHSHDKVCIYQGDTEATHFVVCFCSVILD